MIPQRTKSNGGAGNILTLMSNILTRWMAILAVFALVYSALGVVLYGPLEES